jgi:predicted metalloprotease
MKKADKKCGDKKGREMAEWPLHIMARANNGLTRLVANGCCK